MTIEEREKLRLETIIKLMQRHILPSDASPEIILENIKEERKSGRKNNDGSFSGGIFSYWDFERWPNKIVFMGSWSLPNSITIASMYKIPKLYCLWFGLEGKFYAKNSADKILNKKYCEIIQTDDKFLTLLIINIEEYMS